MKKNDQIQTKRIQLTMHMIIFSQKKTFKTNYILNKLVYKNTES